jgi:hypothetical protein
VLLEAVLMETGQEGELVAWSGGIHYGLRVVARLDLMFGREQGSCEEEREEAHLGLEIRLGLGLARPMDYLRR